MATNKLSGKSSFDPMFHFEHISSLIRQTYDPLIDKLKAIRDGLLEEVSQKREEYCSKENERKKALEESAKLWKGLRATSLRTNILVTVRDRTSTVLEQELDDLRIETKLPTLLFQCPTLKHVHLQELIDNLGRLVTVPIYTEKSTPIVTAGKKGGILGDFEEPRGLAIDELNQRIFIADSGNHRVQVFNFEGGVIAQFGQQHLKKPWGIAVTGKYIYITDTNQHLLFQFTKDSFNFHKRSGGDGKKVELKSPQGLSVDERGDVFIADTMNHRVALLTRGLQFMCCIGAGQLQYPRDVELTEDSVLVIDDSPNCVHIFSKKGELQTSFITQVSDISGTVRDPRFFCRDISGNFILSGWGNHRIVIRNNSDKPSHLIGSRGEGEGQLSYPSGIAVSQTGIIFVVSHNRNYALQCF